MIIEIMTYPRRKYPALTNPLAPSYLALGLNLCAATDVTRFVPENFPQIIVKSSDF